MSSDRSLDGRHLQAANSRRAPGWCGLCYLASIENTNPISRLDPGTICAVVIMLMLILCCLEKNNCKDMEFFSIYIIFRFRATQVLGLVEPHVPCDAGCQHHSSVACFCPHLETCWKCHVFPLCRLGSKTFQGISYDYDYNLSQKMSESTYQSLSKNSPPCEFSAKMFSRKLKEGGSGGCGP